MPRQNETSEFLARVQQGRDDLLAACQNLYTLYHPGGWRHEATTRLYGCISWSNRVIACPRPTTRRSLYVYLYMVALVENQGHAAQGRAVLAKTRVRQIMQHNGIAVPQKVGRAKHTHSTIDARTLPR